MGVLQRSVGSSDVGSSAATKRQCRVTMHQLYMVRGCRCIARRQPWRLVYGQSTMLSESSRFSPVSPIALTGEAAALAPSSADKLPGEQDRRHGLLWVLARNATTETSLQCSLPELVPVKVSRPSLAPTARTWSPCDKTRGNWLGAFST